MKYHTYEVAHTLLHPWRAQSRLLQRACSHPLSPLSYTVAGRKVAAGCQVFEGVTRRYGKRAWGLTETVPVHSFETPICAYAAIGIGPI
jgi:poly(3-hydroxybutyrate) depolymerase